MAFSWNAFSPILLASDSLLLAACAFCIWRRLQAQGGLPSEPSWTVFAPVRLGALLGILPWVIGGGLLGGILGLAIISRSVWALVTVGLPILAVVLWCRWRRAWLWVFFLLPLALKVYGEVIEPGWLEVETVRVPVEGLRSPVKIVHLSDLQTDGIGRMHLRARVAANDFSPDFVVFTGDILNHPSLAPEVLNYLQGFRSGYGNFFVSGNVDGHLPLAEFCNAAGFELLDGRAHVIDVRGNRVGMLGLALEQFQDAVTLGALVALTKSADIRLLLSHVPDAMEMGKKDPITMLFAGHTHGGQVTLPWFGPILTMSGVPRRIAAGGLHKVGSLWVLVSRGLGWEGHFSPRVRLFCRPHLILVELVPA